MWRSPDGWKSSTCTVVVEPHAHRTPPTARIDAFLYVTLESHQERQSLAFERSLEHIEQILSCYILSGHDDYLLRVVETDLDALARFIRKVVAVLLHVRHVRSAPIMQVVKEARRLPIPE